MPVHEEVRVSLPTRPIATSDLGIALWVGLIERARADLSIYRDASRWEMPWTEDPAVSADGATHVYFRRVGAVPTHAERVARIDA